MSIHANMKRVASSEELTCTVCASFPCECPSTEQYDEADEDLSDMEIPARVVGNDTQWMEKRFVS